MTNGVAIIKNFLFLESNIGPIKPKPVVLFLFE